MGVRTMLGLSHRTCITRRGLTWDLDLNEGVDFVIFLLGMFEVGTIRAYRRLIRPGDIVLDIGANIGSHTLELACCVGPTGSVVAFEPTDFAFEKLKRNVVLNPVLSSRIRLEQVMLVECPGESPAQQLYSSWPLMPVSGSHPDHCGQLKTTSGVTSLSLDEYVARAGLKRVDFVKLDVDGYECKVLRGAQAVLNEHKPVIIMELAPYVLRETGHTLEELLSILGAMGYELFRLQGGRLPSLVQDVHRMIPHGASLNVLAKVR